MSKVIELPFLASKSPECWREDNTRREEEEGSEELGVGEAEKGDGEERGEGVKGEGGEEGEKDGEVEEE